MTFKYLMVVEVTWRRVRDGLVLKISSACLRCSPVKGIPDTLWIGNIHIWHLVSGIWYLADINQWCPIEALFQNSLEQDIAHSQLARLPGRLCGEKFHNFSLIVAFANF